LKDRVCGGLSNITDIKRLNYLGSELHSGKIESGNSKATLSNGNYSTSTFVKH
jgi:hypothetical protein